MVILYPLFFIGYYLYAEASDMIYGDIARARSPVELFTQPQCLKFFFYMYGMSIQYLKLYRYSFMEGSKIIDTLQWSHNNTWLSQSYIIPGGEYGIIFETMRGLYAYGDVAIDDVSLTSGTCINPSE